MPNALKVFVNHARIKPLYAVQVLPTIVKLNEFLKSHTAYIYNTAETFRRINDYWLQKHPTSL